MGIWRTFVSRPADVERSELYYGGPVYIAGYTPDRRQHACTRSSSRRPKTGSASPTKTRRESCSRSRARTAARGTRSAPTSKPARTRTTRGSRSTSSTPRGIAAASVIIGDAAHSCPPTIAQGAAQGLEDALVLTELLVARDAVDQALWDEFHARRLPRAYAQWSRHPCSSASGRSTGIGMPTPAD